MADKSNAVKVKSLKFFRGEEGEGEKREDGDTRQVAPGREFECDRGRAAQLFANGLVAYLDEKDAPAAAEPDQAAAGTTGAVLRDKRRPARS